MKTMHIPIQAFCILVSFLISAMAICLCASDFPLPGADNADGWEIHDGATIENIGEGIAFCGPGYAFLQYMPSYIALQRFRDCKGIGFRIKGDGKPHRIVVGLWEGRFRYSFMLEDAEWHDIRLAWSDFVNRTYDLSLKMGETGDNGIPPVGFARIMLGDDWQLYHANTHIAPYTVEIADLRLLEEIVPADRIRSYPQRPLEEALEKMRSGNRVLVVCNGDSITAGTGVDEGRYANLLQKMLREHFGNPLIEVKTIAVGGASTRDLRVWARSDYADSEKPDLATLMIGYNDRCWYNASTEAYKAGLDDLCARINDHTQGAPLVLFTPAPGTGECYGLLGPYAVATREVAAKRGLPLFDLNAILSQKGYDALCGLYFDRAHPNAEGHRIIAEELFRFLVSFTDK